MGYSCTAKAAEVLDAGMNIVRDTESSNVYRGYFFERGRENYDGAITCAVWKFVGENSCRKAGSIRIDADGTIVRWTGMTRKEMNQAQADGLKKFESEYPLFGCH